MKNIICRFVCLLLIVFLISCRTTRQELQKTETEKTEKEKVVSYKDTTLFVAKTQTSLKLPIRDLQIPTGSNTTEQGSKNKAPIVYTQKNGQATATVRMVHDTIVVTATCDSLALVAKIRHELFKEKLMKIDQDFEKVTQIDFWDKLKYISIGFVLGALSIIILIVLWNRR